MKKVNKVTKPTHPERRSKDATELIDKIEHARSLHAKANQWMLDWEKLYKNEFSVPQDIFDKSAETDTAQVYKPSKAYAIVRKTLSLLSVRAELSSQVVPKNDTESEERACSLLEQYLEGYTYRVQDEARRPVFRHAVLWALLRGKAVICAQYRPVFLDSELFPIRPVVPDPIGVWEVTGDTGVIYYASESKRYAWELRREIERKIKYSDGGQRTGDGRKLPGWKQLAGDYEDTDLVTTQEYWDGEYYAMIADGQVLLPPTEHNYGFCPIAVAYMEDTPFSEIEWKGQSILAPVMDALKTQAALFSKLSDASASYFYPIGIWQSPDGRVGWITSDPATMTAIPVDAKVTFYNPQPNIQILERFKGWLDEEINIATLPEIAYATSNEGAKSGFAIAQTLSQVQDKIQDKKENLQQMFGWHYSQVLRLTEKFAPRAEKGKFEVMALPKEHGKQSRRTMIGVGADQVGGRHTVLVGLTPLLPNEKMALVQQAKLLSAPDPATKLPLVDRKTVLEMFPELFKAPDEIESRLDEEHYKREIPQVAMWYRDEFMSEWSKTHPPHVPEDSDLKKLSKDELIQRLEILRMYVQNPQALQAALAKAAGTGVLPSGMISSPPGLPGPGMPPEAPGLGGPNAGVPTSVAPAQMQSGNPDPLQGTTPEALMAQSGAMPPRPGGM